MESNADSLHRAARLGDMSLISKALTLHPEALNQQDTKLGWSALYRSVICGHQDAACLLLKHGADPNLPSKSGETPLHLAAVDGNYHLVKSLLEAGADPNLPQPDGETALHKAAAKGKHRVCWLLLRQGADPNRPCSSNARTPLHFAVTFARVKAVKMLLSFEADPNRKDRGGNTALDLASTEEIRKILGISMKQANKSKQGDRESLNSDISGTLSTPPPLLSEPDSAKHKESIGSLMEAIADFPLLSQENLPTVEECESYLNYTSDISVISQVKSGSVEPECEQIDDITKLHRSFSFGTDRKMSSLYSWLAEVRLESVFDTLVEAGYDDLEVLKREIVSSRPLSTEKLRKIGIRRPGHCLRLLACLEEEIRGKPRIPVSIPANSGSLKCCGPKTSLAPCRPVLPNLQQWLDALNLAHLISVFVDAGLDDLEHLLGLMHTRYMVTDQVLKEDVGISKVGYRQRILIRLEEDCPKVDSMFRPRDEDISSIERPADSSACNFCQLM